MYHAERAEVSFLSSVMGYQVLCRSLSYNLKYVWALAGDSVGWSVIPIHQKVASLIHGQGP